MNKKHNENLDILRGLAALFVVLFHLINIYYPNFDTHYELGTTLNYNFPGHLSVLVFFILSGFVINANTAPLNSVPLIVTYIRKRLVRIIPIYVVAILFTVAVTWGKYGWDKILSNLFLISVPLDNVYVENGSVWSLNYELIYYFLFILFSRFRIPLGKSVLVILASLVLLFGFCHNLGIHPLIISYGVGFLFWLTGAWLAQSNAFSYWSIRSSRTIALFILLFCIMQFNPFETILNLINFPMFDYVKYSFFQKSIAWYDLMFYPLCILLIGAFTHTRTRLTAFLVWFTYLLIAVFLFIYIYKLGFDYIIGQHWLLPLGIYILSIILWFANFNIPEALKLKLRRIKELSGISYGMYILHLPLIFTFGYIIVASPWLFAGKLVLFFAVLLFLSWLLELKFQKWINKTVNRIVNRNRVVH